RRYLRARELQPWDSLPFVGQTPEAPSKASPHPDRLEHFAARSSGHSPYKSETGCLLRRRREETLAICCASVANGAARRARVLEMNARRSITRWSHPSARGPTAGWSSPRESPCLASSQ